MDVGEKMMKVVHAMYAWVSVKSIVLVVGPVPVLELVLVCRGHECILAPVLVSY